MNILKWIGVIVVAYAAGYFSHFPDVGSFNAHAPFVPEGCPPPLSAFDDIDKALVQDKERMKRLEKAKPVANAEPAKAVNQEKGATRDEWGSSPQAQPEASIAEQKASENPTQPSSAGVSNITDEEIDKIVPSPFNEHVKRTPGKLREKLKEFSEATEQDEWDINIQNKVTDFLLGSSYSKFIELHSVNCKANFCEIRGRELKTNVFGVLFPEMMLQDWWDIADSQWSNGGASGEFYALVIRRPSNPQ